MEQKDEDFERIYGLSGKLSRHVYVLGSYTYDINEVISIEPTFFLRSVNGAKTQTDIGIKSDYKEIFWLGMNYKMNNDLSSIAALIGYKVSERFNLGYSYGLPSTDYFTGSHEVVLGIKFLN